MTFIQNSCRFACYHVIVSQTAAENNASMLTGSVMHNFCHFE